ncbi:MAG: 3-dehydroquinate synthase [Proteobacteria bacterium]|nr:3-dehydroquinate synthase [Pseudomonadota bacterium]
MQTPSLIHIIRTVDEVIEIIAHLPTEQCIVILDKTIDSLYPQLCKKIEASDYPYSLLTFYPITVDQHTKSLKTYASLVQKILKNPIHRNAYIVCIGGGTVMDFGGFIAATLLRGVSWITIPTTLLAMIDGAIGGKVGLDTTYGKNLVGSFHLPETTIICPEFLNSFTTKDLTCDHGELIKYGLLDQNIEDAIMEQKDLHELILLCARYKEAIVFRDPQDMSHDMRGQLNIGHTFGHALESYYKMPHHLAVYAGLIFESIFFMSLFKNDQAEKTLTLAHKLSPHSSFPTPQLLSETYKKPWNSQKIMDYCRRDKKVDFTEGVRCILRRKAGEVKATSLFLVQCEKLFKNFPAQIDDFYTKYSQNL